MKTFNTKKVDWMKKYLEGHAEPTSNLYKEKK